MHIYIYIYLAYLLKHNHWIAKAVFKAGPDFFLANTDFYISLLAPNFHFVLLYSCASLEKEKSLQNNEISVDAKDFTKREIKLNNLGLCNVVTHIIHIRKFFCGKVNSLRGILFCEFFKKYWKLFNWNKKLGIFKK